VIGSGLPGVSDSGRAGMWRFGDSAKPEPGVVRHAPWKGSVGLLLAERGVWARRQRSPGGSGVGQAPQGRGVVAGNGRGDGMGRLGSVKLSRIAVGSAVTLSLVGGTLLTSPDVSAQCVTGVDDKGKEIVAPAAVMITGGTITNETVIDISANAGTSISDASGGNNNLATTGGGGSDGSVIASSGNGGVATSAANGGAISVENINSGGNAGNAISVGDTTCAPFTPPAPAPEKPKDAPKEKPSGGGEVVALPDTGVGIGDASALFALIASAGAAATSLGLRRRS
jgi:hypothetical protein